MYTHRIKQEYWLECMEVSIKRCTHAPHDFSAECSVNPGTLATEHDVVNGDAGSNVDESLGAQRPRVHEDELRHASLQLLVIADKRDMIHVGAPLPQACVLDSRFGFV